MRELEVLRGVKVCRLKNDGKSVETSESYGNASILNARIPKFEFGNLNARRDSSALDEWDKARVKSTSSCRVSG